MIWIFFGTLGLVVLSITSINGYLDFEHESYEYKKMKAEALAQVEYWEHFNMNILPSIREDINRQWELAGKLVEEGKLCK